MQVPAFAGWVRVVLGARWVQDEKFFVRVTECLAKAHELELQDWLEPSAYAIFSNGVVSLYHILKWDREMKKVGNHWFKGTGQFGNIISATPFRR